MANVIKTVLTYQLDGSNRDFNIPFEYLARKFVVVTLIGVDRKVLTINTDYRFATRTTISLTKAWGPADGYTTIELRRVTSTTDRLVDFTDGSILRAYDLNVAQIQTMHVAEEARDLTADTIGVNNDGHLDARGRRIVNLANAIDDRDAIPFGQLKTMNQNSWQARNEALRFRNEAETFRNQAEGFKNESSTNATNTKQWRDDAKWFRDEAEQLKNTAGQYADAAGSSAGNAKGSEDEARRIAASIKAASLVGYITRRSFEKGFNVTTWNEVLLWEEDGGYYRWDGTLPKTVPAGSTPETSGGIGLGAWVSVGDASLKTMLHGWQGYSFIDGGNLSLYKKKGVFGDSGVIQDKYEVIKHSDGFWYKYNNSLPFSYGSAPDSNWTNVGKLNGFNEHSPENFGAIPNDPSFDCLPAIKLAIATGTLNLDGNSTYHVTDEVIIPSHLRGNLNGATIKAIGPTWPALKAVVRVSKFPIGTPTVDVANTENQVRGLRLIGSLNIDCADIASYGFYARLMCAESEMGSIYSYNANKYGIVMFACWYFQMGALHANNCARGMALGYSTEGEQGDTYVNATYFPSISAWGTDKSTGLGYDPITDDASKYTIGAGIILGRGLSTSVGVLCSENTSGAGVVTMDPAAWDIGAMYCEGNSKDFTQVGEPKVSLLSSKANSESHTLTISTLHLAAGCGILTRSKQERVLIRSLYRFDNSRTFHSYCTEDTVEIGRSNYYVLLGHNYYAPDALIKAPLNVDFVRSGLTLSEWTSTVIGHFAGSTDEQRLYVRLPASPNGLVLQIDSEDGIEHIHVIGTDFKASLTKKRLPSKLYEIRIGEISTVPVANCSVLVRSKKGDWYYW